MKIRLFFPAYIFCLYTAITTPAAFIPEATADPVSPEGIAIYPGREAELANEEDARKQCIESTYSPEEADKCSHWIALSTCAMNYKSNLNEIKKFISDENMQKYRLDARKNLPPYCNPMAAVQLDLEILDKDETFDTPARLQRWLQIVDMAPKLIPQQSQIIAREMAQAAEFSELVHNKTIEKFLIRVRDDTALFLPEIPPDAAYFLRELENTAPNLVNADTHAILMLDELSKEQYVSAKRRLNLIYFDELQPKIKDILVSHLFQNAIPLFDSRTLDDAVCFPEYPLPPLEKTSLSMLNALRNPSHALAVSILKYEASLRFSHCDFDIPLHRFAEIWNIQFKNPYVQDFARKLIVYIGNADNLTLLQSSIDIFSTQIHGEARRYFTQTCGNEFSKIILNFAASHLDQAALYQKTSIMLEKASEFAPADHAEKAYLLLARLNIRQKKITEARQYLSRIIENKNAGTSVRAQAYYLSICSLRSQAKNIEADILLQEFIDIMPGSALHENL